MVVVQDNHLVAAVLGIHQGAVDLDTHVGVAGLSNHLDNHPVAAVLDSQQVEPENKLIQCINNEKTIYLKKRSLKRFTMTRKRFKLCSRL